MTKIYIYQFFHYKCQYLWELDQNESINVFEIFALKYFISWKSVPKCGYLSINKRTKFKPENNALK